MSADAAAPRETEIVVAEIFASVLGLESVQPDDDAFELGADSIMLTQVVARLRAAPGLDVTLAQVMANPSPRALVASIEADGERAPEPQPALTPKPFPLSSRQTRVWEAEQLHPRQPHQVALSQFELRGDLAPARLGEAVAASIERHEALRTIYRWSGDEPVQEVLSVGSFEVPVELLPEMSPADADAAIAAAVRRGFDLGAELPLRVLIAPHGRGRWRLALAAHNIAFDGWAEHLFLGDLVRAYGALSDGQKPRLPPAQPYRSYARWEREWLRSPAHDEVLAGAAAALRGVENAAWAKPSAGEEGVAELEISIQPARLEALRANLASAGADLATVIGLAFYEATASLSQSPDIAVGTVVDGRGGRFLDTVGSFTRVTPLRPRGHGATPTVRSFGAALEAATAWAALPFEEIVAAVDGGEASSPVFQACYVLQHAPVEGFRLAETRAQRLPAPPEGSAPFDLFLELVPRGRALVAVATSRAEAFDGDRLAMFGASFLAELDRIAGSARSANSRQSLKEA
jgi:acyl carrier protein